jgi:hypothetical protein
LVYFQVAEKPRRNSFPRFSGFLSSTGALSVYDAVGGSERVLFLSSDGAFPFPRRNFKRKSPWLGLHFGEFTMWSNKEAREWQMPLIAAGKHYYTQGGEWVKRRAPLALAQGYLAAKRMRNRDVES